MPETELEDGSQGHPHQAESDRLTGRLDLQEPTQRTSVDPDQDAEPQGRYLVPGQLADVSCVHDPMDRGVDEAEDDYRNYASMYLR
jgi:hypothetical protein